MKAIGKNLLALKELRDTTQGAIAAVAGVTDGAMSSWINGDRMPRLKYLEAIAGYYGVSVDDLTSDTNGLWAKSHGQSPTSAIPPMPEPRMAHAPLLGRVHAGDAAEPDVLDGAVPIPYEVWEHHPHGYFLEVEGSCMDRVYPEGCLVLVDPDRTPQNGSIAVVSIDGGDYVMRRLYRGSSSLLLVADSHGEWDDIVVTGDHEARTYGTVVWFQSRDELQ